MRPRPHVPRNRPTGNLQLGTSLLHPAPFLLPLSSCLLLLSGLLMGCGPTPPVPTAVPRAALPDPHRHVVDVSGPGLLSEVAPAFQVAPALPPPGMARDEVAVNAAATYRAFTGCDGSCRLFLEALATGETFEILGLPLPWRIFSGGHNSTLPVGGSWSRLVRHCSP